MSEFLEFFFWRGLRGKWTVISVLMIIEQSLLCEWYYHSWTLSVSGPVIGWATCYVVLMVVGVYEYKKYKRTK